MTPAGEKEIKWELNFHSQNLQLPIYDSPGDSTDQRLRVLANYFGHSLRQRQLSLLYGACVEKTWSGELGGDGKDIWEESEGASETEVCGQLTRMMD